MRLSCAALAFCLAVAPFGMAQDAATTYKAKCQMCHAADGTGNTPAGQKTGTHDFKSAEVKKMTDQQLLDITKNGKGKMPAYKDKLSDDQIKELVKYMRAFK